MPQTVLQLLGPPRLLRDGEQIAIPTAKLWGILAYLAVEGPQSRAHLAGLMWERQESRARANLRRELFRLRRRMDCLCEADGRLGLAGVTTDLEDFLGSAAVRDWESATRLVRGPFLDGVCVREAPAFEEWLEATRSHLALRYQEGLLACAREHLEAGLPESTLAPLERLLSFDPFHEDAHALRLRALYEMDRHADARAAHRHFLDRLERELGVGTSDELVELARSLDAGSKIRPPTRSRQRRPPKLVGRDDAWQALAGARGLALVVGQGGIGKTRLLSEFGSQVSRIQWVRHREGLRSVGFGAIAMTLRERLSEGLLDGLQPQWREELARLLPELGAAPPRPAGDESELSLSRLWEALVRGLTQGLPPKALLMLDDLHHADAATLTFLPYLIRRTAASGVRVAGASRPEGLVSGHGLATVMRELGRDALLTRIDLPPLTEQQSAQLVEQVLGSRVERLELAVRLHRATQGNPLFTIRTLEYLIAQGLIEPHEGTWRTRGESTEDVNLPLPGSVREEVILGIEALEGRAAAEILAVGETALDAFDLRRLLGGHTLEWADRLERLEAAGYLRAEAEGYTFAHDLFQTAVHEAISAPRRRLLHRIVAEDARARGERAYLHLEAAGELDAAWRAGLEAGREAITRQAFAVAAEVLEWTRGVQRRAGATPVERARVLLALEEALMLAASIQEQRTVLEELEALAPTLPETDRIEIGYRRVRTLCMRGQWPDALAKAEAVLNETEHLPTRLLRADILANMGRPGARDEALAVWERAQSANDLSTMRAAGYRLAKLAVTTESNTDLERWRAALSKLGGSGVETVRVEQFSCAVALGAGRWEEAERRAARALSLAESLGYQDALGVFLNFRGMALAPLGRFREALEAYESAHLRFGELGRRHFQAGVAVNLASLYLRLGAFTEAETWAAAARERFLAIEEPRGANEAARALGISLLWQGRLEAAEARIEESLALADAARLPHSIQQARGDLGVLRLHQGRYVEANRLLRMASNEACPEWPALAAWQVVAHLQLGRLDEAEGLARSAYARRGRYQGWLPDLLPLSLAAVLQCRGEDAGRILTELTLARRKQDAAVPQEFQTSIHVFRDRLDQIFLVAAP